MKATLAASDEVPVEILEDGSIVSEHDNGSVVDGDISTTRSVMQLTEAFMDELCVGVENDLLGKDDNYKDIIRDYRKNKRHYVGEEDTVLSSSLDSGSDFDDIEHLRSEHYENKRTKTIIQALLFGGVKNHKKHQSSAKTSSNPARKSVDTEPIYNPATENANFDSVEVGSTENASSALDAVKPKGQSLLVDTGQGEQASIARTEAATDTSSTAEEEEEETEHSSFEETLEKEKTTVGEVLAHVMEQQAYPSIIDAASVYTELSPHTLERQATFLTKKMPSHTSKLIADHVKQRHAIYLWSLSVLRQKLEDHQFCSEEAQALLDPTSMPQTIHEYNHSILLALGYAINGGQNVEVCATPVHNSAFDWTEVKQRLSQNMALVIAKSKSARYIAKDALQTVGMNLLLRKRVLKPKEATRSINWPRVKKDLAKKAALTAQKSIRFVRNEAILDTMYIAVKIKKRAIKLHETLSLLPLQTFKMRSTNKSVVDASFDPFEDFSVQDLGIKSSMDYSLHDSRSFQFHEESIEVFEPLPTYSPKPIMKRKLSKTLKKKLLEWKASSARELTKDLVPKASKMTAKTMDDEENLEDSVMYLMEQDNEEDEITYGFEVAAM
jgi:hypothetical protein